MRTPLQQAKDLLAELANDEINEAAALAVDTGRAHWEADPYVDGVYGLILNAVENRAIVVVYLDPADFEVDEELLYV